MKFQLKERDKIILNFDLLVFPTGFQVSNISVPEENCRHPLVEEMWSDEESEAAFLHKFLSSRSIQWDYERGKELDEYVCKRLGLRVADFGRMDAYQGLVGLFDYFRVPGDDYSVSPVFPEALYFGEMDCRFTRLYSILPEKHPGQPLRNV